MTNRVINNNYRALSGANAYDTKELMNGREDAIFTQAEKITGR
jgi:hypothetical protein